MKKIYFCLPKSQRLCHNKKLAGLLLDNDIWASQITHELLMGALLVVCLHGDLIEVQVEGPSRGVIV